MKHLKFFLLATCALVLFGSCSTDDKISLTFSKSALYFQWGGESQTVSYTSENLASISIKSKTSGWECDLNTSARTLTITPPAMPAGATDRDEKRDCEIKFDLTADNGETSITTYKCHIIGDSMIFVNEGGKYANSYVLTSPKSAYVFDVTKNGAGQPISGVAEAVIVWQSRKSLIDHFVYDETTSTVTFYVDALTEEDDEDVYVKENGEFVMRDGNAVIAAVDSSDNILWSWHLWFSKESNNPLNDTATYANGVTFMTRNLGAYSNSNGSTDDEKVLESYGLYYQWGRKDPFLRPYYHDCSHNDEELAYTGGGSLIDTETVESSAEHGTIEYAIAHPTTFIINATSVEEDGNGVGDWLYVQNNNLWSGSTKSLYDPCPYGWRVPAGNDFDCLSLPEDEDNISLEQGRNRYGWFLTDGVNRYFYTGAGLRSYYDGHIHNMNHKDDVYPSQPEPWEGYYWTAGISANGKQSTCMYFDLTTTRTINKFNLNYPSKRANAMQIRCVKIK